MLRGEVPSEFKIDTQRLSVTETVDAFKLKLIELIGDEFYENYQSQIAFAISVNEIECWLLPIYFTKKTKAAKTVNCIGTLNTVLKKQEGFYIDEKRIEYYEKMSKPFKKGKSIAKYAPKNPSFEIFIDHIKQIIT